MHNVRRVIRKRAASDTPLKADDLRELAVMVVIELNAHPSCTMKHALPAIEMLLNQGDFVHVDGILRPRISGEPETPTKQELRARSEQTRGERHKKRRASERSKQYMKNKVAVATAESCMLTVA